MNKVDEVIMGLVIDYYNARDMPFPDATKALLFLTSEVGEVADAHVDKMGDWVRNNERERNEAKEVGDVLFMLYVYAIAKGISPVHEMMKKMKEKLEVNNG